MNANRSNGVNRRNFLKGLAGIGGGFVAAGLVRSSWASVLEAAGWAEPRADRIGVQLYTVTDQLRRDFAGTLERVAQIGYKEVEFAGYFGHTPEQVRELLGRFGLTSPSAHIGMNQLREDLDGQIRAAHTIGQKFITVPSLGRTETPLSEADTWKRVAEEFNRIGARLKSEGLRLAFHNHAGEFVEVSDGRTGMDIFVSETDPSLVDFELDLMWAAVAGQDPVAWFERYPGRFKMWHVKDMKNLAAEQAQQVPRLRNPRGQGAGRPGGGGGPTGQIVPVGHGDIDFRRIFARWERSGLEHFFVEHDGAAQWPGGSLASIQSSHETLKRLLSPAGA